MLNLSTIELKAVKQLHDDADILILPADKGRSTVIVDKCEYECKMRLMLNDSNIYKKLKRDTSLWLERKMNGCS